MHEVLHFILTNVSAHWADALKWIAGGGGVWAVTQLAKNVRQWEKASVIQRFALLAGFLGTASDWFITNYSSSFAHANNPFILFPAASAGLFTIATFIHHTPLKSVVSFLTNSVQPYFQAVGALKAAKATPSTQSASDSFQ